MLIFQTLKKLKLTYMHFIQGTHTQAFQKNFNTFPQLSPPITSYSIQQLFASVYITALINQPEFPTNQHQYIHLFIQLQNSFYLSNYNFLHYQPIKN